MHRRVLPLSPSLVCLLVAMLPGALTAQVVRGVITDTTTGRRVAGARVTMSDVLGRPVGTAVSGTDGTFVVAALRDDTYIITIRRLGFQPLVASPQVLRAADTLQLHYHLYPLPVRLDPLVVEAEAVERYADVQYLHRQGFYKRIPRTSGRFLDPAAIDRRREFARRPDDFLIGQAHVTHLPNAHLGYRLRCGRPKFFIDDREFFGDELDQAIDLEDVLAMEIYDLVRPSQMPDFFYGRCAVVVWTRAAPGSEDPMRDRLR
ncbi:MAG: carboxypeptidase regulatory-like domain-containing protein [Gemmatimonadetes bacterium]|nr:carboxypeptidase regulatory-like domain-containing protein [Gemmatimonadota bacterium]